LVVRQYWEPWRQAETGNTVFIIIMQNAHLNKRLVAYETQSDCHGIHETKLHTSLFGWWLQFCLKKSFAFQVTVVFHFSGFVLCSSHRTDLHKLSTLQRSYVFAETSSSPHCNIRRSRRYN
jgi:hypothetical protein